MSLPVYQNKIFHRNLLTITDGPYDTTLPNTSNLT